MNIDTRVSPSLGMRGAVPPHHNTCILFILTDTKFLDFIYIYIYIYIYKFEVDYGSFGSRDSSVGITTRYGLDGPGIESRWGRNFLHPSRLAMGPTQPPI